MQLSWNCDSCLIFSLLGTPKPVVTWPHPLRAPGSPCFLCSPQPWGGSLGKASCCPVTPDIWCPSRREERWAVKGAMLVELWPWLQLYNFLFLVGMGTVRIFTFPSQTKTNQAVCLTPSTSVITSVYNYHPAHPSAWQKSWGCQRWGTHEKQKHWVKSLFMSLYTRKIWLKRASAAWGGRRAIWTPWIIVVIDRLFPTLWELSEAKHHPALLHITAALGSFSCRRSLHELSFLFPPHRIMSPCCRQAFSSQLQSRQMCWGLRALFLLTNGREESHVFGTLGLKSGRKPRNSTQYVHPCKLKPRDVISYSSQQPFTWA